MVAGEIRKLSTFTNELLDRNIEILSSTYNGVSKNAEFVCKKEESHPNWKARVNDVLRGGGCPICGRESQKTKTTLPIVEVVKRGAI